MEGPMPTDAPLPMTDEPMLLGEDSMAMEGPSLPTELLSPTAFGAGTTTDRMEEPTAVVEDPMVPIGGPSLPTALAKMLEFWAGMAMERLDGLRMLENRPGMENMPGLETDRMEVPTAAAEGPPVPTALLPTMESAAGTAMDLTISSDGTTAAPAVVLMEPVPSAGAPAAKISPERAPGDGGALAWGLG